MKSLWRILLVGLLALVIYQAWQRLFVTDETRIRRLIAQMEQAVERNNLLTLANGIDRDYRDDRGLDKGSLLGMIRSVRQEFSAMFIHITDLKVTLADDRQTAQATLVARIVTRRAGSGESELNADRIRLSFRRTDNGWKLTRADSPELRFD